ncbi:MAG: hypothetical protein NXI04_20175 [Planctomycetaceae bacterium]|nr:hypothetical protein [Planctomycetaceae bacterium]
MFRITSSSLSDFSIRELSKQSAQLQDLQRQLSTGLKAERPSDDPALVRKALVEADRVSRFEQHAESLNQNTARLEQAHIQTRDAQQLIVRAKTLALSARQSTDESEINIIAAELDGVLEQLTTIANTEDVNGFLFAGTRTGDRPYPESISTSNTSTYAGNQDPLQLYITGRETSTSLQPGLDVFGGAIRGPVEFLGDNGIAPGTGGSSAIGFHSIEIQHLATEYLGTSGVDAGVSSSASDTVIGQRGTHTLTINDTSGTGASGTVRLNNGVEVAFTSADTDLQVTGPTGEVVYIDTTAITAGYSGDIDIIASGSLSVDGGASSHPITFEDNQEVTDARDGSVIYLNTSGTRNTSSAELEFTGTFDAFQTIVALKEDLLNARDLPGATHDAAIGRRIDDLDRINDNLLQEIGVQSVNLERFDQMATLNDEQKLAHELSLAETTAVDYSVAAIQLQDTLNLQQYTMAAVRLVTGPNLIDFLN